MSVFATMQDDKAHVLGIEPNSFVTQGISHTGIPVFFISVPDDTFGCGYETYASGTSEEAAWEMAVESLS